MLVEPLELVRKLKSRLARYKELYSRNEVAVREQIVSPFLRVSGWNTEDPKCVIPEGLVSSFHGLHSYYATVSQSHPLLSFS